ncbi:MAG TPA: transporter substrate-binding domain-containing protein [Casimicrobiaceae bacterium]|nr:transporter substrate-binding domain-containing protein [Casimicrobiaceae bacterium]
MTLQDPSAALAGLAPAGRLRAAINHGNPVLATWNAARREAGGIAPDLARELARRLRVDVDFVPYESAGKVVAALALDAWDVCFLAVDPERAADIAFTAPYAIIEGSYLVAQASTLHRNEEVDHSGTRVGAVAGSAYDLFLSRKLERATIVREASFDAVLDRWTAGALDCVAGIRPQLEAAMHRVSGLRMLPGRFMTIEQAMGAPRRRGAAADYLRAFVDDVKRSGFVAEAFERYRITGASLASA